ncbi:hypothetical protein F4560_003247 [Saccharothrix ecbatanensis]|uniref:Uncharacterized protein n=1 Tax=Saccharothrix ecbatanensis TaxID=1105145 RepID=A0A7W9HJJ3_9PSEU|nr:hypothetical protein [Saccharothrix ecbatanensis]MBB5803479.1 hypothetical protein [Saccharothrix ecbatanensis]
MTAVVEGGAFGSADRVVNNLPGKHEPDAVSQSVRLVQDVPVRGVRERRTRLIHWDITDLGEQLGVRGRAASTRRTVVAGSVARRSAIASRSKTGSLTASSNRLARTLPRMHRTFGVAQGAQRSSTTAGMPAVRSCSRAANSAETFSAPRRASVSPRTPVDSRGGACAEICIRTPTAAAWSPPCRPE